MLQQKRKLLFLQGNEYLKARDLVQAAAAQYGLSGSEYCDLMKRDSYWGGGPEIVVGVSYFLVVVLHLLPLVLFMHCQSPDILCFLDIGMDVGIVQLLETAHSRV